MGRCGDVRSGAGEDGGWSVEVLWLDSSNSFLGAGRN